MESLGIEARPLLGEGEEERVDGEDREAKE
jgi:hypothetical protein